MFTKWLSVESQSKLPNFGTHIVRVEAIIIRENPENPFVKEVLLIREKHGKHKDWKLISGNVELGEFVEQAVVREVKEEVGLNTHFISILGHGNRTSGKMGRNEIFFICNLLLADKNNKITLQEDEITEAKWFNIYDAGNLMIFIRSNFSVIYLKGLQKRCLNAAIQKRGLIKFISNEEDKNDKSKLHAHFIGLYGNWRGNKILKSKYNT
jgi:ADP-ribose pyrophosphatase YjhB (NUDIX family)